MRLHVWSTAGLPEHLSCCMEYFHGKPVSWVCVQTVSELIDPEISFSLTQQGDRHWAACLLISHTSWLKTVTRPPSHVPTSQCYLMRHHERATVRYSTKCQACVWLHYVLQNVTLWYIVFRYVVPCYVTLHYAYVTSCCCDKLRPVYVTVH